MDDPFLFHPLRVMPLTGKATSLHQELSLKLLSSGRITFDQVNQILGDYGWQLGEGDPTTIQYQTNETWRWEQSIIDTEKRVVARCFITSVIHPRESGSGITFTEVEGGPPERKIH